MSFYHSSILIYIHNSDVKSLSNSCFSVLFSLQSVPTWRYVTPLSSKSYTGLFFFDAFACIFVLILVSNSVGSLGLLKLVT